MTRAVAPIRRPAVRYFGGKWHQAPFIVRLMPVHATYVEPFGGGASVLLRKPRASVEVLNDLDPRVVSLYSVLADETLSRQLAWSAYLTPYRQSVFRDLKRLPEPEDDLGRALRLVIRGAMSMSSSERSGYRSSRSRPGRVTSPFEDWVSYRLSVPAFHARLKGVRISQRPALDVMLEHDGETTLHYVDPPYVHRTRKATEHGYRHEMDDTDHAALLEVLKSLKGYVLLSGYACPLYDEALRGWTRLDRTSIDGGGSRRTESVWMNPAGVDASTASDVRQLSLF